MSGNSGELLGSEAPVEAREEFECSGAAAGDGEGQADVERPIV